MRRDTPIRWGSSVSSDAANRRPTASAWSGSIRATISVRCMDAPPCGRPGDGQADGYHPVEGRRRRLTRAAEALEAASPAPPRRAFLQKAPSVLRAPRSTVGTTPGTDPGDGETHANA
ncbi:hypothetical protein Arub01_21580 [Actinomadura rubrobrunea]|uniref:Uncharacterized protein n=1 Tax=Actinomadura rubrobrunea TaxID=115335 RepID=A0A9W6PSU8_9ACTN|nr:hypothetical protein Arub01_21580 [Actinomadura rubrobrunea]